MKINIKCTAASKHPMQATLIKLLRASRFTVKISKGDLYVSSDKESNVSAIGPILEQISRDIGLSIRYDRENRRYFVYSGPSVVAYVYIQQRSGA